MTSPTADAIGRAPMGHHLEDLGGGAMPVAAHQERGRGPVAPQRGPEPDDAHRGLGARGTLARSAAGGHPGVGGACDQEERQRTMVLRVRMRERQRLLAMRRVIGVIEVKHHGGGGLWGAGAAGGDQHARAPGEILAVDAVCKPGNGRGTRQVLRGLQGGPLDAALPPGVVPEPMGLMALRLPRSALVETLGHEVPQWMIALGGRSLVRPSGGKAFGAAHLAVDAT
jgi:hypothetical protein